MRDAAPTAEVCPPARAVGGYLGAKLASQRSSGFIDRNHEDAGEFRCCRQGGEDVFQHRASKILSRRGRQLAGETLLGLR